MSTRETELLTEAEYARHRAAIGAPGATRQAVHKAVKAGRISTVGGKIHARLADEEWQKNSRSRVGTAPAGSARADNAGDEAAPPAAGGSLVADSTYNAARTRRELAEAEQAEIEVKKRRGELVVLANVQRAGFEIGRDLRDAMESAVSSLAAEVASLATADACADALRRHNRAICDVLVKGWREKIAREVPLPGGTP